MYALTARVEDASAETFRLPAQKSMYGGKHVQAGDTVYVFDSETDGGRGLCARGRVLEASPTQRRVGPERQTPRVDLVLGALTPVRTALGRAELRGFTTWNDGRPETELNFKLYRQATDKIVGLSPAAARFLETLCRHEPPSPP